MASTEIDQPPAGEHHGAPAGPMPRGLGPSLLDPTAEARFDAIVARRRAEDDRHVADRRARRLLWLSHHWPEQYDDRCFTVGRWPVCRRCGALYGVGFGVALAMTFGVDPWPARLDPTLIWLLCLPATAAFVGEALGWFRYAVRWQVATTLVAGLAFGKALGYELEQRWSPEFWGPVAVFGGLWFFASALGHRRRARRCAVDPGVPDTAGDQ